MTEPTAPVGGLAAADLLAELDPEQQEVATTVHGPVVVVAGAGTGKTRALTHRIAYGVRSGAYEASGVLAVTFTTRAAAELRARVARLGVPGVATRTFHSAALSQVRFLWPRLYGRAFPDVLDSPEYLIADLSAAARLGSSPRELATEIAWAKVSNVAPHQYRDLAKDQGRRVVGASATDVARLYTAYTDALAKADRVDLEDVLLAAVGVLSTQPAAAHLVRQRYRWFTVDEFQDVSALQVRLLECWLGERDDVCVVGDPNQAIYGFAGAHPELLEQFSSRFPGVTRLELTRNYRSTPQVLAVAASVLGAGPRTDHAADVPLHATRPRGAPVVLLEADDLETEAAQVAARVRALVSSGTPERDIAVLARTRAHVGVCLRALTTVGVAVAARGATPFYERPEVRQVVALLAAAARRRATGREPTLTGEKNDVDAADGALLVPTLPATVRDVLGEAGWTIQRPTVSAEAARWESWATVVTLAEEMESTTIAAGQPPPTVADLVAEMREQARTGGQPRGSGVTVATLHATKGQQWGAVFVVGAYEGGIPSRSALSRGAGPAAVREEQRLLYVGLTRAADHLCVSWARQAQQGSASRRPSRFLADVLLERPESAAIELRT